MTDRLAIALVGCGAIAEWHVDALVAAATRTDIVAVVDIDAGRAEALAKRTGARVLGSLDEALADPDVDAVDLMLPHHLHEPAALAALAAGKHVLLEKPIAPSVDAADRILAAAASAAVEHGTVFMVAENAQYWPEVLLVDDLVRSGAIGEIITARAWHCFPPMGDFYSGDHVWRFSAAEAGGGVAIDAGSHWIRPLRMWLGEMTEVVAALGHPYPGMEGESMCRSLCRFESGVVASFDAFLVPGQVALSPLFQVTGTLGELIVEPLGDVRLFDGADWKGTVVGTGSYLESYQGEFVDFESAVLDGTPLAASAGQALGELRAAHAMYRSAVSRTWEAVWG